MSNCIRSIWTFERFHFKNYVLCSKEIQGHFYYKNIVKNCTILNKKKRNECFSALLVVLEEQLGGSFAFLLVIERATKIFKNSTSGLVNCIFWKLKILNQTIKGSSQSDGKISKVDGTQIW